MQYLKYIIVFIIFLAVFIYIGQFSKPEFVISANFKSAMDLYQQHNYLGAIDLLEKDLSIIIREAKYSHDHAAILTSLCLTYVETNNHAMTAHRCEEAQIVTEKVYGLKSEELHLLTASLHYVKEKGKGKSVKIIY